TRTCPSPGWSRTPRRDRRGRRPRPPTGNRDARLAPREQEGPHPSFNLCAARGLVSSQLIRRARLGALPGPRWASYTRCRPSRRDGPHPRTRSSNHSRSSQEAGMQTSEVFIGGQWRPPLSGETYATINPATEEVSAHVAKGDERDVDLAVQAARRAF